VIVMSAINRENAKGFTLVEVIVASVLLLVMIMAVMTLSVSGAESGDYAKRLNRVTELTQDLVDRMRLELVSSVRTFGDDAEGTANLAVFDLAGTPTRLTGSRLPHLAATGSLQKDTSGSQITGNSLFFARLAWSDRFACTSGNQYLIDVYRWVYYYLSPVGSGPTPDRPDGLDLVCVTSEPLVDAAGIDRITDVGDQREVYEHLLYGTSDALGVTHPPCQVVWLRGGDPSVAGTLRQIDESTWTLSDSPLVGRPNPWRVLRSDADFAGLLAYRHHSVATIHSQPSFGVGKYGFVTTTGSGFPHGFEVQVIGPSSARQILLHLVAVSTVGRRPAWSDLRVVVDGREL